MDARELNWQEYNRLKEQGLSQRAIAKALALPESTLRHALKRRPDGPPAAPASQVTPTTPAVPAPPAITMVAVSDIQEILSIVKDLQARVVTLEQAPAPPASQVLPAPPATPAAPAWHTPPAPPAVERKDVVQWTVRLSKALIEHIKAVAYERRINPSEVVEECLWTYVHRKSS